MGDVDDGQSVTEEAQTPPRRLAWALPAVVLLSSAGYAGTLADSGGFWAGVALLGLLLISAWLGASGLGDPLRLGRRSGWLVWLFCGWVMLSSMASPVGRAGSTGMVLLPLFFLAPSMVENAWASRSSRRWGLCALLAGLAVAVIWALLGTFRDGRAALPLGHHNLLATWLLGLWPLAAFFLFDSSRRLRWFSRTLVLLSLAVLVMTRSVGGASALALQAILIVGLWLRKWRPLSRLLMLALLVALLLPLFLQRQRLREIAAGTDLSARARLSFLAAGYRGFLERPLFGWGPGATPWTAAEHWYPEPGIAAPGFLVADLHCLPLQLLYELGLPGAALFLTVCGLWLVRRGRVAEPNADAEALVLSRLSRVGLAGQAVQYALGGFLAVAPALPLSTAVLVGVAQSSLPVPERRLPKRMSACVVVAYCLWALYLVSPPLWARRAYERARIAGELLPLLQQAVEWDPGNPLYRMRWGWLRGQNEISEEAVEASLLAAEEARGVASLWLAAGLLAFEAGDGRASMALDRACALDPLGAIAPYYRWHLEPRGSEMRSVIAARMLLAEPLLATAPGWHDGEQEEALDTLRQWPGVPEDWLEEIRRWWLTEPRLSSSPTHELAYRIDAEGSTSMSRYLFQRRPWPMDLGAVPVAVSDVGAPAAATRLAAVEASAFRASGCGSP